MYTQRKLQAKRHLKIILTEPNASGLVVVATVFTLRREKKQEMDCVLKAGDHPFIRHDSIVAFSDAKALPAMDILAKLQSGELIRKEEMSASVFERVLQAAKASSGMFPRIKSMLFSSL